MFKRLMSMLLAVCMCFCLSSVAFASENAPSTAGNDSWTKVENAEVVVDSDGWAMVEVPTSQVAPRAGGTEVWSSGTATRVGTFTMAGNNLTPVKTIKTTQYSGLAICVDSYTCSKPVVLSVQIRRAYTNTILGRSFNTAAATSGKSIVAVCDVSNGDKVQIFFRITDANGKYDDNLKCTITYSYRLVNDPFSR